MKNVQTLGHGGPRLPRNMWCTSKQKYAMMSSKEVGLEHQ